MHILYLATQIKGGGGVARIVSQKTDEFIALGHCVTIISTNDVLGVPFYPFNNKVCIISYPHKVQTFFALHNYYQYIKNECNTLQPDCIFVIDNGIKGYFAGLYLNKIAPIYFESHGSRQFLLHPISSFWKRKLIAVSTALLSRYFDGIIVLNKGMSSDWKHKNIHIIPNWIQRKLWQKAITQKTKQQQIIAVGRLVPEKNYEMLFEVWKKVVSQCPNWKLVICGGGNPEYVAFLQKNQPQNIEWKGEIEDLTSVLATSSFMIHTSKMEGMPMAFLEGMSAKLPVVAFDVDFGPADLISDNINGFIIPFGAIDTMKDSCFELIQNEEKCLKMGEQAYESVAIYEKEIVMKKWISLLTTVAVLDDKQRV